MKKYIVLASIAMLAQLQAMEPANCEKVDYAQELYQEYMKEDEADIDRIKTLVRSIECNKVLEGGNTPLGITLYYGLLDESELLIDKGADMDAETAASGVSYLMRAALNGLVEQARLLVDKGACLETTGVCGVTALMIAAANDQVEVVKLLMDRGANLEVKDGNGYTALTRAMNHNHYEVKATLISHAFYSSDCLSNKEYEECEKQFLTGYLSLAKYCKEHTGQNQKDVYWLIMTHSELGQQWFPLFRTLLSEGKAHKIPSKYYGLAVEAVLETTIKRLKLLVVEAQKLAWSEKEKNILNPEMLLQQFGDEMKANIIKRIKYMVEVERANAKRD